MRSIDLSLLRLQYILGRVASLFLGPLYFSGLRLMGYRVHDLARVREEWAMFFAQHEGPWIICANHLTMVDSLILTYAMVPLPRQILKYRLIPWNLPEKANFQRNPLVAVLCYLAKCIPISRGGNRQDMKKTLEKCLYLLGHRQNLLIFPEGGRSRTGRVNTEHFSYGVGRFVQACPESRIMCVYMRGDGQKTYSAIPRRGERFSIILQPLIPQRSELQGLRAQRDYAGQIIQHLAKMEKDYDAACGQRYCGFNPSRKHGQEPGSAFSRPRVHTG